MLVLLSAFAADAATIRGVARDISGAPLPGVTVEVAVPAGKTIVAVTDKAGSYSVDVPPASYEVTFRLINFASVRRTARPAAGTPAKVDATLPLEVSASIVVTGKQTFRNLADLDEPVNGLIGVASAASVGVITARQIESRAEQRPAAVLETIPGVIISQHSGEGKANQYYLRGFNLDHGTDFATTVAGAPVNMPTHAHGQGYSDNNFLIPELISGVQYTKGPYYADQGDFSSAGTANINYVNFLQHAVVSVGAGSFGQQRVFAAGSSQLGEAQLLGALEVSRYEGPWKRPDDYRKLNGLARFTSGSGASAYSLTLANYDGRWSSTDQIPDRALRAGTLSRFEAIDASDGGKSYRRSLVGEWQRSGERSMTKASAYAIGYGLDLFSNFTYYLDDPVNGDQFEQLDRRVVTGGRVSYDWLGTLAGRATTNRIGLDVRHDHIGEIGLFHTRARQRLSGGSDTVGETSIGTYAQSTIQWSNTLRAIAGLRADRFSFDVHAADPANGGTRGASMLSPKLSLIFGPWRDTELYVAAASGFHSNDARGTTITVDPTSGGPANRVDPLVRTRGGEIGIRSIAVPHLQSTLALWRLDIGSELLFVGDAGNTEASRPSRRTGFEWSNYYRISEHVIADADFAYSKSRFQGGDPGTSRIPGALEGVASGGISVDDLGRFSGSLRFRYLGPRPLTEDNSIRSSSSRIVQASIGWTATQRVRVVVEALNLLNARVSDIDYYYTSRLPGEPAAGLDDVHGHPVEPRSLRIRFVAKF